jgi:hypothetical protein
MPSIFTKSPCLRSLIRAPCQSSVPEEDNVFAVSGFFTTKNVILVPIFTIALIFRDRSQLGGRVLDDGLSAFFTSAILEAYRGRSLTTNFRLCDVRLYYTRIEGIYSSLRVT